MRYLYGHMGEQLTPLHIALLYCMGRRLGSLMPLTPCWNIRGGIGPCCGLATGPSALQMPSASGYHRWRDTVAQDVSGQTPDCVHCSVMCRIYNIYNLDFTATVRLKLYNIYYGKSIESNQLSKISFFLLHILGINNTSNFSNWRKYFSFD